MTAPLPTLPTEQEIAEIGRRAFESRAVGRTIPENWLKAAAAIRSEILARLRPAFETEKARADENFASYERIKASYSQCANDYAKCINERDTLRADLTRAKQDFADHIDICADHLTGGELRKKLARKDEALAKWREAALACATALSKLLTSSNSISDTELARSALARAQEAGR